MKLIITERLGSLLKDQGAGSLIHEGFVEVDQLEYSLTLDGIARDYPDMQQEEQEALAGYAVIRRSVLPETESAQVGPEVSTAMGRVARSVERVSVEFREVRGALIEVRDAVVAAADGAAANSTSNSQSISAQVKTSCREVVASFQHYANRYLEERTLQEEREQARRKAEKKETAWLWMWRIAILVTLLFVAVSVNAQVQTVIGTRAGNAVGIICDSGCSGGTTDTDDGSVAGGQASGLSIALGYVWNGAAWVRDTGAVTVTSGTLTGITNPVAVTGTFWQATQPVSINQTTTDNDVDANITNASLTITDGAGALNVICDSGCAGGTQYAVDAALGATPTGTLAIAIRDDALSALTPVEGDAIGLRVDANGALWVIPSGTVTVGDGAGALNTIVDSGTLTAVTTITNAVTVTDGAGALNVICDSGCAGGVQYTEGDIDATITGTATMMEVAGNTLQPIQGSVASGLLVDITDASLPVTQSGTWDEVGINDSGNNISVDWAGTVPPIGAGTEAAALRVTVATDSTGVLSVDDNGGELTVNYGSGTFVVGDGAGALNVICDSGCAGGTQYTEDDAAPANPVGTALAMVRDDVLSAQTTTDGDIVAARGTDKGELYVKHVDAIPVTDNAGNLSIDWAGTVPPIGAGTEAAALRVTVATDSTGVLSVDDNGGEITVNYGSGTFVVGDGAGALNVICDSGCTPGGSFADNAAFTFGTTAINVAGYVVDDTATNAASENSAAAPRMSTNRVAYSQLRDAAGNERGANVTAGNALVVDGSAVTQPVSNAGLTELAGAIDTEMQVDVITSALPTGASTLAEQQTQTTALQLIDNPVQVLGTDTYTEASSSGFTLGAVRRDADTTLVNTTNEFGPLQMDANGRLKVEAFSGETLPVSLTSTTITGTVAVTQSGTWNITDISGTVSLPTGAATAANQTSVIGTDGAAGPASVLSIGGTQSSGEIQEIQVDADGQLQADVLTLPNVTIGTFPDNEPFNVAQINGVTPLMGNGATGTGSQRVTIASDNTAFTVNIGTFPDNEPVNVAQMNGVAVTMGNGTAGTGVQRVAIASDNSAVSGMGVGATGAAPPANANYVAGLSSGATGGFLTGITICDSHFPVDIVTATTTLAVTGVSGRHVRICGLSLLTAGANNVAFIAGTGATCGTSTAGMAGGTTAPEGFNFAANGGISQGSGIGEIMRTETTGDSVCIVTSAAVQLSGNISYTIY